MSGEENKAIVSRFFKEVFNKKNIAFLDEYTTPDAIDHLVPPNMPPGREGSRQFIAKFLTAFPDLDAHLEDIVAEGDKVVTRTSYHGTNTGAFMGMPATGRPVASSGIDITRLANGKSVEHWGQLDMLGILQQLGVIPTPGQGGA
jgi:predicted ester cyclase